MFGGGSTPVAPDLITLNAVAYDRHGDPVADLRPDEVFLSDAGKPQQIVSLRLDQTHKHQPIVILFDLLNSRMTGRALVKNEIVQSLRRVESSDNLYLYILTKRATLFAIRGLEDYEGPPIPENVPWIQVINSLLDSALKRLDEIRSVDMDDPDLRLQATLQGLTSLAAHVSSLPGRKSIIWISHGVPIDTTWYADAYTANISQLCARMVFDAISVYAVHESVEERIHLDTGNFLEQFTGLTGGVTFPSDYTADAISQALKDARVNYSIAYRPERFRWDGQFHKIRLRSSRSGVRLRTVAGYYAAAQRQSSRSRWPSAQAQTPIVWPA